MMSPLPLISVCVCTYRRTELLRDLLTSLAAQCSEGFRYEVVVVDNDKAASARDAVEAVAACQRNLDIRYEVEPIQGISYARNHTLRMAEGEILAFIDDDEVAAPNWLADLYGMFISRNADVVLGPVLPVFPEGSSRWVLDSGLFERSRFPDGSLVGSGNGRTGNALVRASWCRRRKPACFDEALAHSGGEDHDFFRWVEAHGGRLLWSDTACVSEVVPFERQVVRFVLGRRFRASTVYWRGINRTRSLPRALLDGVTGGAGAIVCLAIGALVLPMGFDKAVRVWARSMNGFGRLAALTKLELVGYGTKG